MMGIKLARLAQLIGAGKTPNFESIDDTLLDAMNYPGLLKAYRRQAAVDKFMAEEDEEFGGVLESEYSGLLDAVVKHPFNDVDFPSCYNGSCDCEAEADPLYEKMWSEGDEFMLTDTNIYFGYGPDKEIVGTMLPGPFAVTEVKDRGVRFRNEGHSYYATWTEIRPV